MLLQKARMLKKNLLFFDLWLFVKHITFDCIVL